MIHFSQLACPNMDASQLTIPNSKTDQKGQGHTLRIYPYKDNQFPCPVDIIREYLAIRPGRNIPFSFILMGHP